MKGRTNELILKSNLQRRLRRNMTDAEQLLWRHLRRRQMADYKFRRQHPFGDFIIDFVCLDTMLAIEVDGGQHISMTAKDKARSQMLESAGFRILRFWNNEVLNDIDAVLEVIWNALQTVTPPPSQPSP